MSTHETHDFAPPAPRPGARTEVGTAGDAGFSAGCRITTPSRSSLDSPQSTTTTPAWDDDRPTRGGRGRIGRSEGLSGAIAQLTEHVLIGETRSIDETRLRVGLSVCRDHHAEEEQRGVGGDHQRQEAQGQVNLQRSRSHARSLPALHNEDVLQLKMARYHERVGTR